MSGSGITDHIAKVVDPSTSQGINVGDSTNNAIRVNVVAGGAGGGAVTVADGAVPADADYIGFNVSGNLTGVSSGNPLPVTGTVTANAGTNLNTSLLALESGGNLATLAGGVSSSKYQVNIALINGVAPTMGNGVSGTGVQRVTIASDSTGQITANAGTNLNTSALALETGGNLATIAGTVIVQEATTSGVKGITVFGAVTTNAPSYTTAKSDALSLTPAGGLRVDLKDSAANTNNFNVNLAASAATVTVSGNVTANAGTGTFNIQSNASVNVAQLAGTATSVNSGTKDNGTLRVVIATDQPQLTNKLLVTPDANSAINVAQVGGNATAVGNGTTSTGTQRVTLSSDGTGQVTLASGAQVQPIAGTTGGDSWNNFVSANSNNKTQVKGSAGTVYEITVFNIDTVPYYLKVFDKTSANVNAGTTACDYQIPVPANATAANGAGITIRFPVGRAHANGITVMLTTGIGTTDNTSVAANKAIVDIGYK